MSSSGKTYWKFAGISAILVILTRLLCGNYYDNSDDVTINLLLRGEGSDFVINDYYRFYFILGKVISGLYGIAPGVPWQGVIFYLLVIFLVAEVFLIAWLVFRDWSFRLVVLAGCFMYLLFVIENVMYFDFTRHSTLLAGVGCLGILASEKLKRPQTLRYVLFLILGILLRPNGGMLAIVILFPTAIIISLSKRQFRKLIFIRSAICLGIFVSLYLGLNQHSSGEVNDFKKKNYLKSNIWDFGIAYKPEQTKKGLLLDEALGYLFVADSNVSIKYLESRTAPERMALSGFQKGKFNSVAKKIWDKMSWDYAPQSAFLFLLLCGVLVIFKEVNPYCMRLSFSILFFAGALFALGYFLKLPDKIIGPAYMLFLMISLYSLSIEKIDWTKYKKWVLISIAGFALLFTIKTGHRVLLSSEIQQKKHRMLGTLNECLKGKKVITAKSTYLFHYLDPLKNYDVDYNFINLSGWLTLHPQYKTLITKQYGASTFEEVINKAKGDSNTRFVFYESGMADFLTRYMNFFYQHELKLQVEKSCRQKEFQQNKIYIYSAE